MLVIAKSVVDTPAAAAMVWNVVARKALKLAAGAAVMAATAAISAATLVVVAASADAGGRTVASQVTSALAWSWRAASPRRDARMAMVIHDGGTPSLAARSAMSAVTTAAVAAVPAAAAGTDTVSVSVMTATGVVDGLTDVDGVIMRATLADGVPVGDGDGERVVDGDDAALADVDNDDDALADTDGDGSGLAESLRMATLRLVIVAARTPASLASQEYVLESTALRTSVLGTRFVTFVYRKQLGMKLPIEKV